jgi:zinc D-Ala-D-Ala carboxypeptidase
MKIKHLSWDIIGFGICLVLLLGLGYWAYADHKESTLKVKELEYALTVTTESATTLQLENATLTEKLRLVGETVESLEKKNKKLDKQKDELKKLTETDGELLKKYSKIYFLNENYSPRKLATITPEYLFTPTKEVQVLDEIENRLTELLDDARDEGINLSIASAYRSFDTQKSLKTAYKVTYGAGTANQFSAEQGYSEHQLGTAIDFTTTSMSGSLTIAFDKTPAYAWLADNAYKYGFILSYPKGNSYYQYEPWHWRFVGEDLARYLHKKNMYFYDLDQRHIDGYLGELFD